MIKLLTKESEQDALKRIREAIKQDNYMRVMRSIIREGFNGYKRDLNVYKVNEYGRRS